MTSTIPIKIRLAILEYLGRVSVDVSAEVVADVIGRSRSVTQRHLSTLCKEGVIEANTGSSFLVGGNTKMYSLTVRDA